MSNFVNKLNRMEHTYQRNVEEIEKSLRNIGVNILDDSGCYRPFLEVLTDIKERWNKFSNDEKETEIIKDSVAQSIAGIRDKEILKCILECQ